MKYQNIIPYLQLTLMSICFSGIFITGKMTANEAPSSIVALFRFIIASILLISILLWKKKKLPSLSLKQISGLIAMAFIGVFVYNLSLLYGLSLLSASRSALIFSLNPIFIAILSSIVYQERIKLLTLIGVLLSILGVIIVISNGSISFLYQKMGLGELVIVFCTLSWATYSLISKTILHSLSPIICTTSTSVLGVIMLLPVALASTDISNITQISASTWLAIFYMGSFGTVIPFILYYQGIKAIGVVKASAFLNLVPIFTILLSLLILHEVMSKQMIIGSIITFTGIFLINWKAKQRIKTI